MTNEHLIDLLNTMEYKHKYSMDQKIINFKDTDDSFLICHKSKHDNVVVSLNSKDISTTVQIFYGDNYLYSLFHRLDKKIDYKEMMKLRDNYFENRIFEIDKLFEWYKKYINDKLNYETLKYVLNKSKKTRKDKLI